MFKKHFWATLLAIALSLTMVVASVGVPVYAADEDDLGLAAETGEDAIAEDAVVAEDLAAADEEAAAADADAAELDAPADVEQEALGVNDEFEFPDPNMALRRATFQSSAIDQFYTSTLITDGITSSPFLRSFTTGPWVAASRYYYEWIYVDLGNSIPINSVSVDWGESYATRYKIQTSDDAANWTTRVHKGSNTYTGANIITGEFYGTTYQTGASALGLPIAPWANATQTDAVTGDIVARYVRILCETCSGGAEGGTYTIKGISVNDVAYATYYETLAGFDSYWASKTAGTEWVYVDLGAASTINGVKVSWGGNYATAYSIQTSDDAQAWNTVYTGEGVKDGSSIVAIQPAVRATYVRVLCEESSGPNYMIRELKVNGINDVDYKLAPLPAPKADGTQYLTGGNWKLERASIVSRYAAVDVKETGERLSKSGYDDSSWLPATVPSTTLVSYLNAGAIPDPFYDTINMDISDTFFTTDYWYRDSFVVPAAQEGKDVWLNFDAINYRADIFFNGQYLPNNTNPERAKSIEGGFIRGKFDVTDYVNYGGENYLAVFIQMNDTPWCYTTGDLNNVIPVISNSLNVGAATTITAYIARYVSDQGLAIGPWPNGGNLGADNPTFHAAAGWDWMPTIRGRDTGIYRDVYVTYTGGVEMLDPWMVTDLDIRESDTNLGNTVQAQAAYTVSNITVPAGQAAIGTQYLFDRDLLDPVDRVWLGDNSAANPGFTVEFAAPVTARIAAINWGEVYPNQAYESQNATRFTLEASADGVTWRNFDAYSAAGTTPASDGTASFTGTNLVNVISAESATGTGTVIPFRFLRFTTTQKLTSQNSTQGIVAPKIVEIQLYNVTRSALNLSGVQTYTLDDRWAYLTFKTEVKNNRDSDATATIKGTISPSGLSFSRTVSVPADSTIQVDISNIVMANPQLWWPNTYGDQPLYTATVQVEVGGQVSDSKVFNFGVREFTYNLNSGATNRLAIYCNGTFILAKGGNWGMDDGMQKDDAERYDNKIRLTAEENLTMIRNWVGQTYNKLFYDACDKYGIMIWDDFWLANPYDGSNPKDRDMFNENAIDRVKVSRSHPSLTTYVGRNESNPPTTPNFANTNLVTSLTRITTEYDGTRVYYSNSAGAPVGSGGGYSIPDYRATGNSQGMKQYFTNVSSNVLRSERGIANVPTAQSIRKFVSPANQWPISESWGHHDWTYFMNGPANTYMNALKSYMPLLNQTGDDTWGRGNITTGVFPGASVSGFSGQNPHPDNPLFVTYKNNFTPFLTDLAKWYTLDEFSKTAQMINYENHKALFQALTVTRANGLLMWMSQSSWPSFMWQTYDYFLDTNGGYFGVKNGNQPTQITWDPRTNIIYASNFTRNEYVDLVAELKIFNLNGVLMTTKTYPIRTLAPNAYGVNLDTITDAMAASNTDMLFIRTTLKTAAGEVLGENTYWHNRATYLANQALATLSTVELDMAIAGQPQALANGNLLYTLVFKNNNSVPTVQTRVRTISEATGEDVLPTFYSDNYFALMPGETKVITAEFDPKYLEGGDVIFQTSGWNTAETSNLVNVMAVGISADEITPYGYNPEFTIKGYDMVAVNAIELTFVVDAGLLGSAQATLGGLGGFSLPYGIEWTNLGGGKWQAKAVVGMFNETRSGTMDIAQLVLSNLKLGTDAKVTLTDVRAWGIDIVNGVPQSNERLAIISPSAAATKIYSAYDFNDDGAVDMSDLSLAMYFYMSTPDNPNWAFAKVCDVNGDGRVDMGDLIEIYANFTA